MITEYKKETERLEKEQNKYDKLCDCLCKDLREGIVTKAEFDYMNHEFKQKAEQLKQAQETYKKWIETMLWSKADCADHLVKFQDTLKLEEVDRHTLTSMVKRIDLYENKRMEIEFYFQDKYQIK